MKKQTIQQIKKETHKVFILLLIGIILISFLYVVSAGDEVKTKFYDVNKQEVTISNATGIIAKLKLDTPINNVVMSGKNVKIFEITVNSSFDYNQFFKGFTLYDLKTGKITTKTITIKFRNDTIVKENVPTYKTNCVKVRNVTSGQDDNICTDIIDGSKSVDTIVTSYEDMPTTNIKKGLITIAGFTDVKNGDYIEWIPNFYDIQITEWATYLGSDFTAYWKFNQTSGNAIETLGRYNFTNLDSGSHYTGGILGNSVIFNNTQRLMMGDDWFNLTGVFTIAFWVNLSGTGYQYFIGKSNENAYYDWTIYQKTTDNKVYFREDFGGGDIVSSMAPLNNGQWHHIVITQNTSHMVMFVDGSLQTLKSTTQYNYLSKGKWCLGSNTCSAISRNATAVKLDNLIVVVNKSWNQSDVDTDYNSGVGIEYANPTVNLIFPTFRSITFSPTNNSYYLKGQTYQANVIVNNSNYTVGLEINNVNKSCFQSPVNNQTFICAFENLSAGAFPYYFWSFGNDSNKYFNRTVTDYYTVRQADGSLKLLIDGIQGNTTITNGTLFYINGSFINGTGILNLYNNNTLLNSGNESIYNVTQFNITGTYIIRLNYSGNTNFTASNIYYTVTVVNSTIAGSVGKGIFYLNFNSTKDITLFIIMLVVSILTLMYVNYVLGCTFIIIDGFIALINYSGLFLGVSIIIVGIVLVFIKQDN